MSARVQAWILVIIGWIAFFLNTGEANDPRRLALGVIIASMFLTATVLFNIADLRDEIRESK